MPAMNLDKRKVSSLNIDFIDTRDRINTEVARPLLAASRMEVSSTASASHNFFDVTTFLMQTDNISRL
jgi:hypothetical protein